MEHLIDERNQIFYLHLKENQILKISSLRVTLYFMKHKFDNFEIKSTQVEQLYQQYFQALIKKLKKPQR